MTVSRDYEFIIISEAGTEFAFEFEQAKKICQQMADAIREVEPEWRVKHDPIEPPTPQFVPTDDQLLLAGL